MITYLLIAVNVIATLYAWNRTDKYYAWMLNPYSVVKRNQYYRILTSGFIHNSWVHLLFNMITLYFFGRNIEVIFSYYFGGAAMIYYLILYFIGMVVADIPSIIKNRENPHYNSLGASGAVSAVLFASILFNPSSRICLYFALCMPGFIFGVLYIIYSYYAGRRAGDNINHDAHLYGALFGIVFSIFIKPDVISTFFEQVSNFSIF
jgi:membrane associated rhomboid family serine protease